MAVQAQYPSNLLLLNRNIQEGKNEFSGGGGGGFVDQQHMIFNNNGVGINPRKRNREEPTTTTTTTTTGGVHMNNNSFSFSLQNHHHHQQQQQQQHQNHNQNQNHQLIDLSMLQNQPNVVSTGLRLSFGEQQQQQIQQQIQQQPTLVSLFSEDYLTMQLKQQSDELNYFLQAQGEQLRRALAEKRRRHYRALLDAAEEAVARELRHKDAEVEKATLRAAELEAQWAHLCAEAQSWRARAQAHEAQAVALQAQIQQAQADAAGQPEEAAGMSCAAEDGESAYVDPVSERRRVDSLSCKACWKRVASVVLLPCRHLCICTDCDGVVSACPLCLSMRSASVEVFLT